MRTASVSEISLFGRVTRVLHPRDLERGRPLLLAQTDSAMAAASLPRSRRGRPLAGPKTGRAFRSELTQEPAMTQEPRALGAATWPWKTTTCATACCAPL